METINIYCDESCHILNSNYSNIMAMAALICPKSKYKEVTNEIKEIKLKHNISVTSEMKWTKISSAKESAYLDLVKLFFKKKYLEFRIILINKDELKKSTNYNTFYYKMCYLLIKYMMRPQTINNIYLDKKDTLGYQRISILHDCLDKVKDHYDMDTIKVNNIQNIQSHEVQLMQITDILMGAVVYDARKLNKVTAKTNIINFIKDKAGLSFEKTTPLSQHKFNILKFRPGINEEM